MLSKFEIRNAIYEARNTYPEDDLIVNYRDFLNYRDVLRYFQYNHRVFESLLTLTVDMWKSQLKINRASLLHVTKRYRAKAPNKLLSAEMQEKVFWLFTQVVIHENMNYSRETIAGLKFSANNMLTGMMLTDEQQWYLVEHVEASFHVLNRILRYPHRSAIFSQWVYQHFLDDAYRLRRAELVSWLLDDDPDYKLDMAIVTDDFEYECRLNKALIQHYQEDYEAYKVVKDELVPVFLTEKDTNWADSEFIIEPFINFRDAKPVFEAANKRQYRWHIEDPQHKYDIPDLAQERIYFYENQKLIHTATMAWAIAYSRLEANEKTRLLKLYFNPDIDYTFLKVGSRTKNVEFLEWLEKRVFKT
jgi:hypothetical protein